MPNQKGLWAPLADELAWPRVYYPLAKIVYLDINHFINLAKVLTAPEKVPPGYPELLDALRRRVRDGKVVVPLSFGHIWEMYRIRDPRQRRDVAQVMEDLSGFNYILSRPSMARLEIASGLDHLLSEDLGPRPALPLIRYGAGTALGVQGGLKMYKRGNDSLATLQAEMGSTPALDPLDSMNLEMERALLQGPPDEFEELMPHRWAKPQESDHGSRLDYELDIARRLDDAERWRRGRLRDLITASEIAHEWLDAFNETMASRDAARGSARHLTDEQVRFLFALAPHIQVAISLRTAYHRNAKHVWTANDIADIDAASVAFAYCNVIFTDKAVRNALISAPELRCFGTFVPKTPSDLTAWLQPEASTERPSPDR